LVEECRCFHGRAHFYKQAHLDPGLLFFVGELLDESREGNLEGETPSTASASIRPLTN
jgi:hypothetical protein